MSRQTAITSRRRRRSPFSLPKGWKKGREAGSKMVIQRVKDAQAFTSSIAVHKEAVVAGLAERLSPGLRGGETLPDHALTLELVSRSVEVALGTLRRAHRSYVDQTVLCNGLSRDCDRLAKDEVYPRAVSLRRVIDATFGKELSVLVHGFRGRIPSWRDGLRQQVGHTLELLESERLDLPEPKFHGTAVDREAWIRQIKTPYETLTAKLSELETQDLRREFLGLERRRALKAFDQVMRETRDVAGSLFTMAGCHERLRKNLRAYYERRWLSRWARQRREARRQRTGETGNGSRSESQTGGGPRQGKILANVSTWLASRFKSA